MSDLLHCPAVLAVELPSGGMPTRFAFERDEAAELAACIGADLEALLPNVAAAHLVVAGGLYDSAQLLRPGWPVFATLGEFAERGLADASAGHLVAYGTQDGRWPVAALETETGLVAAGGMLFLPWLLLGEDASIARLGAAMERDFIARGEAGPRTADFLIRALGVRCEHARYLTRHDLCALTCVQLEHAGFAAAWQLLEAALLAPEQTETALSARGRRWRYADGLAQTGSPSYGAWLAEYGHEVPPAERAHAYAASLFELRQYAALFAAHRLPLAVDGVPVTGQYVLETRAALHPELGTPVLYAHEAPALGIVAISAAQALPDGMHWIAHGWPLSAAGLAGLRKALTALCGEAAPLRSLGRIGLDAAAEALAIPPEAQH